MDDILWNDIGLTLVFALAILAIIIIVISFTSQPRMTPEEFAAWIRACNGTCQTI